MKFYLSKAIFLFSRGFLCDLKGLGHVFENESSACNYPETGIDFNRLHKVSRLPERFKKSLWWDILDLDSEQLGILLWHAWETLMWMGCLDLTPCSFIPCSIITIISRVFSSTKQVGRFYLAGKFCAEKGCKWNVFTKHVSFKYYVLLPLAKRFDITNPFSFKFKVKVMQRLKLRSRSNKGQTSFLSHSVLRQMFWIHFEIQSDIEAMNSAPMSYKGQNYF